MSERIIIFDSIPREGAQSGHYQSVDDRVRIAHLECDLGVDVIEAGFPASSRMEMDSVKRISEEVPDIIVCALSRIRDADIETTMISLEKAKRPRVHLFIATSDIHLKHKLRITRKEACEKTILAIEKAKRNFDDIEFSAEDATRSDWDYLVEIISCAISSGATTINVPDTVGYTYPSVYQKMIEFLIAKVTASETVLWSVHCHDDLGLAVANSLAGVKAGARQIEGCFLGVGERAGNAKLEPILMALATRQDIFPGYETRIKYSRLGHTCKMISSIIGYPISRHYPIVGDFAFNHSSGIHQDGVIKFRETYEIIKPESVGWEGTRMRLVSQSGKAGVAKYITELGYDGSDLISDVMPRFKALSSMKKEMSDDDLHMIVREVLREREADEEKYFCIDNESIAYSAIFGKSTATAEVVIRKNGQSERGCSAGDGPIDAVCKAINKALSEFKIAIRELCLDRWLPVQGSGGAESNAWIIVHISLGEKKGYGRSADPDTVKATAKAYLDAINHALASDIQFSSED